MLWFGSSYQVLDDFLRARQIQDQSASPEKRARLGIAPIICGYIIYIYNITILYILYIYIYTYTHSGLNIFEHVEHIELHRVV